MMHEPIYKFIECLKEWAILDKDYEGQDYITVLSLLTYHIGSYEGLKTMSYDPEVHENVLKDRMIEIVEKENISEPFLVMSLANHLSYFLKRSIFSQIESLELANKMVEKIPDREIHKIHAEKMKSPQKSWALQRDYYRWLRISTDSLGEDVIHEWENEEILKHCGG